jgi:hypothetical protein
MSASVSSYTWANPGSNPLSVTSQAGAPNAAQAQYINQLMVALIATADGDTTLTITHNWNLSAAQQAMLMASFNAQSAAGQLSQWYMNNAALSANTIQITKSTAGGSGAAPVQAILQLLKPSTIGQ